MADYVFYKDTYLGGSIPETEWPRLAARAREQLERYKAQYAVEGSPEAENKAVCAMADALYYFEAAANGGIVASCSVGSVSSSIAQTAAPDVSPKAQAAELYRCARQYLSIYRGCGRCSR